MPTPSGLMDALEGGGRGGPPGWAAASGAGGKGSWARRPKESLAFPGLAGCPQAGGGCRAAPLSPCRVPCQRCVLCQPLTCCRRAERVAAEPLAPKCLDVCGSCPSTVTTGCQSALQGRADTTNRAAPPAQTPLLRAPVVLNPQSLCRAQSCALPASRAAGPRGHAGLASFCPWGATRLRALSGISAGSGRNAAAEGTMRHLAPVLSVTRSAAAARAQPCTQGAGRMQMEMTLVAVSCGRMRPAFSSSAPDAEPGALGGSALCRRAEQCPLPVT